MWQAASLCHVIPAGRAGRWMAAVEDLTCGGGCRIRTRVAFATDLQSAGRVFKRFRQMW